MKIGIGPVWVEVKQPFKKLRERRQRKKAAKRGETTRELLPLDGGETSMSLRTSTNAGLAGVAINILLQVMGLVPALQSLAASPEFAAGLTTFVMWIVARLSKTPAQPGVL